MDNQYPYLEATYMGTQATTTAAMTAAQLAPVFVATGPLLPNDPSLYAYQEDPAYVQQQLYSSAITEMPQDTGGAEMPFSSESSSSQLPGHEDVKSVSDVMKDRRREKNRASQAAFRERRKIVIEGLKEKLDSLQNACDDLKEENTDLKKQQEDLRIEIERLSDENHRLRSSIASSPSSESGYWHSGSEVRKDQLAPMEPSLDHTRQR